MCHVAMGMSSHALAFSPWRTAMTVMPRASRERRCLGHRTAEADSGGRTQDATKAVLKASRGHR